MDTILYAACLFATVAAAGLVYRRLRYGRRP